MLPRKTLHLTLIQGYTSVMRICGVPSRVYAEWVDRYFGEGTRAEWDQKEFRDLLQKQITKWEKQYEDKIPQVKKRGHSGPSAPHDLES